MARFRLLVRRCGQSDQTDSLNAAFCALDPLQEPTHTDVYCIQTKDLVFFQPLVAKELVEGFNPGFLILVILP